MKNNALNRIANRRLNQAGIGLLEMLVAVVVLIVGVVAVAALVPVATGLNAGTRYNSAAVVIAQRELDGLLSQPLSVNTFSDAQGLLCPLASNCNLGNPAAPGTVVGSPVIMSGQRPLIDYTQARVVGYSFSATDPNDPNSPGYDVRWAVITFGSGGGATGRRLIVGARRLYPTGLPPVTLDAMVEK